MIVFAAYTPHSPLLLPTIGREQQGKLRKTLEGMRTLATRLAQAQADTMVVISSHATAHADAFSVNLHDAYRVDLRAFGDLATTRTFEPDLALTDALQRHMRKQGIPLTLDSDPALDHGAGVPLLLLLPETDKKIVLVSYSELDPKMHLQFGRELKEVLSAVTQRVAVIASGDLSHCLSAQSPSGVRKEGKRFDRTVVRAVEQMSASSLLQLKTEMVEAAEECAYRPMLILLGLLERMHVRPDILSYEAPFGVGYLVASFRLV